MGEPRGEQPPGGVLRAGAAVMVEWCDAQGAARSRAATLLAVTAQTLRLRLEASSAAAGADGADALPAPGGEVTLVLGAGRQRYAGLAQVRGVGPHELESTRPAALVRIGRRRFFRVPADLPASAPLWSGRVRELSAGGCILVGGPEPAPLPPSPLAFAIALPTLPEPLPVQGLVVRWVPPLQPGAPPDLAIAFRGLSRRQEDALARYVAHRQRELLQSGHTLPLGEPGEE